MISPKFRPNISSLLFIYSYTYLLVFKGGTQVDKAAANRFIMHAISQAQIDADAAGVAYAPTKASSSSSSTTPLTTSASNSAGANPSDPSTSSAARVPLKVTSKMLERQEWQKRVDEAGSEEEEDDIEGWEEGDRVQEDEDSEVKTNSISKGKGKGKAVELLDDAEKLGSKRRRPVIDPFEASGMSSYINHLGLYFV